MVESGMNNNSYIVICFIAAVLILITSYMGTATQASESNNTGINDNNKIDMPKEKNLEENFGNKTENFERSLNLNRISTIDQDQLLRLPFSG